MTGRAPIIERRNNTLLLLIEPDASVRDALTILLQGEGWDVRVADDCAELAECIENAGPAGDLAAVISEASLPHCTPDEILEMCQAHDLPVIFTGHDLSLQAAVDLIRRGAADFLDKPFPQSRLLDLLERLAKGQNG